MKNVLNTFVFIFTFLTVIFIFYVTMGLVAFQAEDVDRVHMTADGTIIEDTSEIVKDIEALSFGTKIEYNGDIYQIKNDKKIQLVVEDSLVGNELDITDVLNNNKYCYEKKSNSDFYISDRCEMGYLDIISFIKNDYIHNIGTDGDSRFLNGVKTTFTKVLFPLGRIDNFVNTYDGEGSYEGLDADMAEMYYYTFSNSEGEIAAVTTFAYQNLLVALAITIWVFRKIKVGNIEINGKEVLGGGIPVPKVPFVGRKTRGKVE